MSDIVNNLMAFFGVSSAPDSFGSFLVWFISILIGVEIVLFVMDSIFYTIRFVSKGVR